MQQRIHELGRDRRYAVTQTGGTRASQSRAGEGLLHRLFARAGHNNSQPGRLSGPTMTSTLNLGDIQGFILRGYRMPMVRHFLLSVSNPAAARRLLGRLVNGNESDAPQVTTAAAW